MKNLTISFVFGLLAFVAHAQPYFDPGSHKLIWDGTTGSGNQAKSGIYYVQLRSGDYTLNKTVKVIKAKK